MMIHPGGPLLSSRALPPTTKGWKRRGKRVKGLRLGKEENEHFQLLNLFSKDNFAHTKQQFTTV